MDEFEFEFVALVVQNLGEMKFKGCSFSCRYLLNPVKLIVALADVPGFRSEKTRSLFCIFIRINI